MNPNPSIPSRANGNVAHPHLHSAPQTFASLIQPSYNTSSSGHASESDENGYSSDMSLSRRRQEWERQERDRRRLTLVPTYSQESLTTRGLRIMDQSQSQSGPRSQLPSWPLMHRSPPPLVLPEISPPQSDFDEDDDEDDEGPPPLIESSPILDNDGGPVYLFESATLALGSLGHEPYRHNVSFQPTYHSHPHNHPSHYIHGPPPLQESHPRASNSSRAGTSSTSSASRGANPGHLNFPEVWFPRNRVVTLEPQGSDNAGEPAGDQTPALLMDKDTDTPDPNDMSPRDSVAAASTVCPQPALRKLCQGEVLYWHHLKRTGEMPGVVDDPRARSPCEIPGMSGRVVREKVFAGR